MTFLWLLTILSLVWIFYAYVGYPVILMIMSKLSPRPAIKNEIYPPISIIITVHNGGQLLKQKLNKTLALHYPNKKQIIVSSDGSTDNTVKIAQEFKEQGIIVIDNKERHGKEAAQASALKHAMGDIVIFTDVTTELKSDALQQIVKPLANPTISCVSSQDHITSKEGEGLYVRYEMAIRRLESLATSLIGLSGSFFAVRRSHIKAWPHDLASDFRCALDAINDGHRAVVEPSAQALINTTRSINTEWQRKIRTVCRGITVLLAYRHLLHPRYGRAAFSLWSHKVARFTVPFALLVIFIASLVGSASSYWMSILLYLQLLFYSFGLVALFYQPINRFLLPRLSGFFLLVNASILVAWFYYLSGKRMIVWSPTQR